MFFLQIEMFKPVLGKDPNSLYDSMLPFTHLTTKHEPNAGLTTVDRALPGALIAWPTLEDQPMWCSRGLRMWHQKSRTTFSGASLWSSYTSWRRPPMFDLTTATRVRLTYLGSTTSTRMPDLKEVLTLSASWKENNMRTKQWQ